MCYWYGQSYKMKCDIEISVTAEEEEYDTIEIPQCLRESTVEPMSNVVKHNDLVCLPDRYANKLRKSSENSEITNGHFGNDLVSREKDLSTALKWIKQEIVSKFKWSYLQFIFGSQGL